MLAPSPTLLLFLGLGPARNQQLRPRRSTGCKIPWKKTCGKTTTKVEDNIRRDSLLLNIRGWRRRAGDRDIWRGTVEEARARCGLSRR
jgi:hypothetical protein